MVTKYKLIKKIFWTTIIIIISWIIFIKPEYNISKLKKSGKLVKGIIYRKSLVGSKGTIRCFYNFDVDGIKYEGFYDNDAYKKGDSLEIIYYIEDPSLNQAKQFVEDY